MKPFKISLDRKGYSIKPASYEVSDISIRIGNSPITVTENSMRKVIEDISIRGYSFAPSTFEDGLRQKRNFKQMQLFALDFDDGTSFDEVKTRAVKHELPILFAYDTLTSTNHNKFRTVFLNDVIVDNSKIAEAMLLAFHNIFPEADPSCKDISKMFYGGKGLLHFDDTIPQVNIEALFRNMSLCLQNRYGPTHYKRKIAEFSKRTNIALNKQGFLDEAISEPNADDDGELQDGNFSTNPSIVTLIGGNLPHYNIKLTGRVPATCRRFLMTALRALSWRAS